jgi:hypothetical protein
MTDATAEQDRLENELQRTRARMDERLTELRDRMTPGQILDDLTGYLRGSQGGEFASNLMANLRSNPVPAALTGIGLIWLMAAGRAEPYRNGDGAERPVPFPRYGVEPDDFASRLRRAEVSVVRFSTETEEAYRSRLDEARGKVLGVACQAEETAEAFGARLQEALSAAKNKVVRSVHDLGDDVADTADQVGGKVRRVADNLVQGGEAARNTASDLLETIGGNPVLLGALGFAGGALLGALIPQSEAEAKALGGIAKQARETASNLAKQAVDTGGKVAERALSSGLESARAHGLSGESTVKDVVESMKSGDIIETAGEVAQDALQGGADVIRGSTPRSTGEAAASPSFDRAGATRSGPGKASTA